jgi:putative isomerase
MGQRYWILLCLSAEAGAEVRYDHAEGVAIVTVEGRSVALTAGEAPLLVTGHDSIAAAAADIEQHGYFDLSSRATAAKVMALRFNLESMPEGRFAAAVADTPALAAAGARAALRDAVAAAPLLQTGRHAGALDAVRDVIGWNTLYDAANARRYTAVSRIWSLGSFMVWYNDQTFAALMAGLFDAGLGRDNLAVALAGATPQGNIACLLTSQDRWVDRTQAPHGAFMAWCMFLRGRDRSLLELAYEPLARNHHWWRRHRDPDGLGLVSCGTSEVGEAMYKGTAFGARNETGMDNSATHDEAIYDPATRTLSTLDVGLNSALALDAEMLAAIARELGRDQEADAFAALAADTAEKIRTELWDEARGLFANRQRRGGFVASVGPTSFFPLLCGAATEAQARRLLDHLADPATFGGAFVLPNATRDDPAYRDNVYWRGRIWPNVNYLVWQGLRRYGFQAEAADLAGKSLALFEQSWRENRQCGENYSAETGEILDQPDNDPFYTWGAMLPLMAVSAVMDIGPWHGWEIVNTGEPVRLGPITSPVGEVTLTVDEGLLTLARGGTPLLATDLRGRLSHLVIESGLLSMVLTDGCAGRGFVRLGPALSGRIVSARLDGAEVPTRLADGCRLVDLAGVAAGVRLDVHLAPRAS